MKPFHQHHSSNTILLSFNDIVFENRNKAYGSYDIRKRYLVSLLYAFLFSASVVIISVVCPMIYYKHAETIKTVNFNQLGPNVIDKIDQKIDVKLPQIPDPPKISISQNTFAPPRVVDTVDNSAPQLNTSAENTENTKNGFIEGPTNLVPDKPDIDIDNQPLQIVSGPEEPALFEGGDITLFHKWVQDQIVYPQSALDLRIEGRVMVEFTIGKDGFLDDIVIVRSADQVLDNEVMRVLKTSPHWSEPRQNGHTVKQRFFMPIFFQIKD